MNVIDLAERTDRSATTTDSVRLESVTKVYGRGGNSVTALSEFRLRCERLVHGDHGPLGVGQEHVPAMRGGSRSADIGSIYLGDVDLAGLSEDALSRLRRETSASSFSRSISSRR